MARRGARAGAYSLLDLPPAAGLDLRNQPGGRGALDLMNVSLTDRGAVRLRDGSTEYSSHWGKYIRLGVVGSNVIVLEGIGSTWQFACFNAAGVYQSSGALAPFGFSNSPSQSKAWYAAINNGALLGTQQDGIVAFNASSGFSATTASIINSLTGAVTAGVSPGSPSIICNWPTEERVLYSGYFGVNRGPNGSTASRDTIWVSEPANPLSFRDSSFLNVGVGDGERIQSIVAWRDLIFIFKSTCFWVLTGVQVTGDGAVRFVRRAVRTGLGAASSQAVCVGRDGVYFWGRGGIYRTTGGAPELLSRDVDPIFGGSPAPELYTGGVASGGSSQPTLECMGELLFASFGSGSIAGTGVDGTIRDRTLVFDRILGSWTLWNVGMAAAVLGTQAGTLIDRLLFLPDGLNSADRPVAFLDPAVRGRDLGVTQPAFYLGPFVSFDGGHVARIRQLEVWGRGVQHVGLATEFSRNPSSDPVSLGSGTYAAALAGRSRGWRASKVALYAEKVAADTDLLISRATLHIAGERQISAVDN